jgi:hypothetical protein
MADDLKDKVQKLRESVDELRATFEQNVELQKELSKLLKARMESLVEAGFSAQEALAIICARGIS